MQNSDGSHGHWAGSAPAVPGAANIAAAPASAAATTAMRLRLRLLRMLMVFLPF